MSIPGRAHPNKRTRASAAAHCGVVGLPDPSGMSAPGEGALLTWCRRDFLPAFDRWAQDCGTRETRAFARAERAARLR